MPNLNISELDFDTIKQNLKEFLNSQSEFTDYDFEGSGLSVLLDVLAYNTHYNSYIANMLANEMFLDSAVKRSSAVSIAKHLGYVPTSVKGASAVINVTVSNPTGLPETLTLPRYTAFSATINGTAFTFLNTDEVTITPVGGVYTFSDLVVTEGEQYEINKVVVNAGPSEKYEIPSETVDTTTLLVTVQNSATDLASNTYTLSSDIVGLNSTSKVYFLEENPYGRYQIYFGDGVLGKKLATGNIVKIRYLSSSGSAANSSNNSTIAFSTSSIGGSSDISIAVSSNPTSGAEKETISSIRFNAPRINAAKNRAVTSADYEALITSSFTGAESVSVWGGEENVPPKYGKVIISLKPYDGFIISQSTKNVIINNILKSKRVLAIQPEIVDPEYFYVGLNVVVQYDTSTTTKTQSQIQTIVRNTINNYFSADLQKFNKDFNKSKLIKLVLDSDPSINNVLIKLKLQKRLTIILNTENTFIEDNSIRFENGIVPGTLSSSRFFVNSSNTTVSAKLSDLPRTMPPSNTGFGTLRVINATSNVILNANVGEVNYGTGEVTVYGFTPTALPNNINDFRVTASVQEDSHNIQAYRNQILVLDDTQSDPIVGREAGFVVNATGVLI